ncbi:hypothetical protein TNCT_80031 [Trichonephila clavata]|uniref:Uncharacterized protein n=1 Tax=Trichonephila clavata TaxID=2740835 RepID=A0A8X6G8T0_TRICU|nr:hypothetical protein TNCT_80031 [Trichonephila clavata]
MWCQITHHAVSGKPKQMIPQRATPNGIPHRFIPDESAPLTATLLPRSSLEILPTIVIGVSNRSVHILFLISGISMYFTPYSLYSSLALRNY